MRRRSRLSLVLLVSLTLGVYFAYHTFSGSHGFQARQKLIERASTLEQTISRLEAVRTKLHRDIALLAPEQPHPDMVELVAAEVLGYVRADALVVAPNRR